MNQQVRNEKSCKCQICNQETPMIEENKNIYAKYVNESLLLILIQLHHSPYQCWWFYRYFTDTLSLVSIRETAAKLDLALTIVFNHRHRLMILLEKIITEQEAQCAWFIEFDETYEIELTKGSTPERRKARHKDEPDHPTT